MARNSAVLCAVSLTAIALAGTPAAAQDTVASPAQETPPPAPDGDPANTDASTQEGDIIVTGVRRSVESALAVKRDSIQVTDSIVAEDIGKLPDNSVTEALQRVTGVQIARTAGEGSGTLVRGLPNIVTTLNGRNIFTTTGRGIALQDIPADLLKQVDVYKTAVPENITGGIAGGINVALRRPFDLPEFAVSANARMVYSEQSGKADPILSGLLSKTWEGDAGKFGAMIAVSHQARSFQENNTFNGTYDLVGDPGGSGADVFRPFVIGAIYNIGERERNSVNASLQWAPSDTLSFYADGFYVKYDNENELNFFIPLPGLIGGPGTVTTLKPDSNVLASISGSNVFSLTSNQAFRNTSETYQGAFGGAWEPTDQITIAFDGAYTKSTAENIGAILDTSFIAPVMTVDFDRDGASSAVITNADGSPFRVTDPANFTLNQLFDQYSRQEGKEYAGMASIEYRPDASILKSIKAGVRYADRTAFNEGANGGGVGIGAQVVPVLDARLDGIVDLSPNDLLDGITQVDTRQFFIARREFLLGQTDVLRGIFGRPLGRPALDPAVFFDNSERVLAGYAQTGFDLSLGSLPVDGLIGVRVENTKSTLQGTDVLVDSSTGAVTLNPILVEKDDTEWLPSANIRFKFTDNFFLRLAAARTVTRPSFGDLNPATSRTAPGPTLPGAGSRGNPLLENVISKSYDASLEWYFRPGSLLSVTGFRRDVDNYIVRTSVAEFFPVPGGGEQRFDISRPVNSGSGTLQGVEVAFTHFLDYLPGALSGFGVQLNGTYIDGSLNGVVDREVDFPSVSKYAANAVLIYEKEGFSARLAYNWRDKYFVSYTEFQNVASNNLPSVIQSDIGFLDLSTSYRVNDNFLITFDAVNLTKSTFRNYFGGPGNDNPQLFPRDVVASDRTFSIGTRINF
jgi:TonB-dependent receptor